MNRSAGAGLWLGYLARRLGVAGWLGLVMLVAAAALWLLGVQPAQEKLASTQQRLAAQQAQARKISADAPRAKTPTEQLLEFQSRFKPRTEVPAALEQLQALAQTNTIELESGDYTYMRNDGHVLDQLRISLPVKGSYVQIRQFMEAALAERADLALQSLSLRREKLAQEVVDGRLVFVLYVDHRGVTP